MNSADLFVKEKEIKINNRKSFKLYKSRKGGKDQESIQSSTTPDPGYHTSESDKNTIRHHKREPMGVIPFPAGDHRLEALLRATRQQRTDAKARQTQDINNTHDPQKKYRIGSLF